MTVLSLTNKKNKDKRWLWKCQCSCDNHTIIKTSMKQLKSGSTKSCGCLRKEAGKRIGMLKSQDLTGKIFGRLTVLESTDKRNDGRIVYRCQCSCNNKTIIEVTSSKLLSGNTRSCGCLQRESVIAKNKANKIDMTGQRIGMLTVLKEDVETTKLKNNGSTYWLCQCDCGRKTSVAISELRRDKYGNNKRHSTWSCGCTTKSVGENKLKDIFNNNHIDFIREKTFKDCVNPQTNHNLRFDFYLPSYNCCIEYDGYTHFEANGGWNTEENLAKMKYRDSIKNKYCKDNNIKLVRIPYWDYNKLDFDYLVEKGCFIE